MKNNIENITNKTPLCYIRAVQSLVFFVDFSVDHCFIPFFPFSFFFCHCIFCLASNYDFWLRIWYLQTFLRYAKTALKLNFVISGNNQQAKNMYLEKTILLPTTDETCIGIF